MEKCSIVSYICYLVIIGCPCSPLFFTLHLSLFFSHSYILLYSSEATSGFTWGRDKKKDRNLLVCLKTALFENPFFEDLDPLYEGFRSLCLDLKRKLGLSKWIRILLARIRIFHVFLAHSSLSQMKDSNLHVEDSNLFSHFTFCFIFFFRESNHSSWDSDFLALSSTFSHLHVRIQIFSLGDSNPFLSEPSIS